MTRYGVAYYGAPISIYGLDASVIDNDTKGSKQRKAKKNRMKTTDQVG